MRRSTEAALAAALTLILGVGFWLFTGESIGNGQTDTAVAIEFNEAAAARGQTLARDTGCLACHTVDGTPGAGPTWKGLAGSSRPLESGENVTADDAYLTLSIVDPNAQVVEGFNPVMPTDYAQNLTDDEVSDLVEYIKSLGS